MRGGGYLLQRYLEKQPEGKGEEKYAASRRQGMQTSRSQGRQASRPHQGAM